MPLAKFGFSWNIMNADILDLMKTLFILSVCTENDQSLISDEVLAFGNSAISVDVVSGASNDKTTGYNKKMIAIENTCD